MNVNSIDLTAQYESLKEEINGAINKVLSDGRFILGEEVLEFEKEFSKYCGLSYGVGVNSGTDALFLALKALRIDRGDEVIVPVFTYIASALAISYTGAKPVFVDIERESFCINAEKIKDAITDKTKAIMVVHLYGHPVDMEPILEIAMEYNLKVIEDCAQAHGAIYKLQASGCKLQERKAGSIGDIGCFSFYPTKNLGAFGDGGMIVTDNKEIFDKVRILRDYGRIDRYHHQIIGYNSRLDTIQASILKVKLKYLDRWNNLRREKAKIYNRLLKDIDEIVIPIERDDIKHVYHIYAIRVKKNRDILCEKLNREGISCLIYYPLPLHLQETYKNLGYKRGDFSESEKAASEVISLPIYPELEEEKIIYICGRLK